MCELNEILNCFPTINDWRDVYLDDGRQRLLADTSEFSVEIILGATLDRLNIFSTGKDTGEMLLVMALFSRNLGSASAILQRSRIFLGDKPGCVFHALLCTHVLTLTRLHGCTHFRIFPAV